jgi:hypothetical protein
MDLRKAVVTRGNGENSSGSCPEGVCNTNGDEVADPTAREGDAVA